MKQGAAIAVALAVSACAATSSELTPKEAAAERAYSAGRYLEAAHDFAEAAKESPRARDRAEARYRQAVSLERAGRPREARAALVELEHDYPRDIRAARAWYDAAILDVDNGQASQGHAELEAFIVDFPSSGLAPPALRRYLESLDAEERVQSYLERLRPRVAATELVQYVDYEHARSLERARSLKAARGEYLRVADAYPYPRGVFWDDSLYRAADLDDELGEPELAVSHLSRMLAQRETSFMQGSYERGRYAEAQFRIGVLYRDALHDAARARLAFERLWTAHPTSRLRDDGAWEAALIAAAAGDTEGACRDLRPLVETDPESRYVPCAPALCPALAPTAKASTCHEYLLRNRP